MIKHAKFQNARHTIEYTKDEPSAFVLTGLDGESSGRLSAYEIGQAIRSGYRAIDAHDQAALDFVARCIGSPTRLDVQVTQLAREARALITDSESTGSGDTGDLLDLLERVASLV